MARLRQRKSETSNKDSKEHITTQLETPPKSEASDEDIKKEFSPTPRSVPDVLYAEDGQTFYPCKHCCRAFANQPDLNKHSTVCAGGRGSPSPFIKQSSSNKENFDSADEEVNNNDDVMRTPKSRGRKRKIAETKSEPGSSKVVTGKAKKTRGRRRKALDSDKNNKCGPYSLDCDTSIITTESTAENINNLNEEMKATVLKNINFLLKNSKISVIAPKESPIIVQMSANGGQPDLQITSRNIDDHCVEIKTKKQGQRLPDEVLPDISEILESNFGNIKPRKPDNFPPSPESSEPAEPPEVKFLRSSPKCPKSVNQESIIDDSEFGEIIINDDELEGAIILEDLDIHICKQCGSVYHTLEDLVNHDKYEHRNVKKRYPPNELTKYHTLFKSADNNICPICDKVLSSKTAWPRHLQTHSVVLNFECRICKKKFTRDDHRKLHEKRHVVPLKSLKSDA